MKQVISRSRFGRDAAQRQRRAFAAADAMLTPSARDFCASSKRQRQPARRPAAAMAPGPPAPPSPSPPRVRRPNSKRSSIRRAIHELKLQICDIGRRLWQRAYVDGNGGNIAIRVGEDIVLCTPTLVSKGFMKPEDMCLVDLEGNQLCGHEEAHERNPDAPADDEAPAARGRLGALPSALQHRPLPWRASSRPRA